MKDKTKLILLGSIEVAIQTMELLLSNPKVDLLGVVCSTAPLSTWRRIHKERQMHLEAQKHNIPVLNLEEACALKADLGLAVRFHQILKQKHLKSFAHGVINLHGAPLPRYRGSMCDALAILNNDDEFAAALHWMDQNIDSGAVIAQKYFKIEKDWTVEDLFVETNRIGFQLISEKLDDILEDKITATPQEQLIAELDIQTTLSKTDDVIKHKHIPNNAKPEEITRIVKAFDFPGHEPAYFEINGKRYYLRTKV